jgi:hypothetical protein
MCPKEASDDIPHGVISERGRFTHFPSVVLAVTLSVGVQMEGVALAADRRGHRRFDGCR